jgi:hypothetical protein
MDKIIEAFLDTTYSEPLTVDRKYFHSFNMEQYYEISHKDDVIMNGIVHDKGEFKYIVWTVTYNTLFKIHKYVPTYENVINRAVTKWVRRKCKSQGISFSNIINHS